MTRIPRRIAVHLHEPGRMGIEWGDRMVDLPAETRILACRLVDWSGEPAELRALADALEEETPLLPGWRPAACVFCSQQVRIGVHQQTLLDLDPPAFTITCLLCAAFFQQAMDRVFGDGTTQLEHAGGE